MIIFNHFGVSTNAIFQVSYATQLTAWSAGPEAGVAVAGLAQQASKLQLGKVHRWPLVRLNLPDSKQILILCFTSTLIRLVESGVELEEWEEALENLRELADCYSAEDF